MKKIIITLFTLLSLLLVQSQSPTHFEISLEEITIPDAPALQSYVVAQDDEGRWLLLGGRTDGLHKRRPFETFLAQYNNTDIFVMDPLTKEVWSAPLSSVSIPLAEQLQSTNMEFIQIEDELFIFGGYGYSARAADHVTHPYLTTVEVSNLTEAIIAGNAISPFVHQQEDDRFQVTGGYAGLLDGKVIIVGGQKFMGLYNPMGPGHGPGFKQEYTNSIKRFRLDFDGSSTIVSNYEETIDTLNLHRRDYNLVPQIFPGGEDGYTAFTGVFRHDVDLPWLNSVDISASGYNVRNDFSQYLNQYHTAHLPIYNKVSETMHTIFFGGIGRYTMDPETGNLMDDQLVPFVKTISRMTRYANDSVVEYQMPVSMPGFLGASAEFIPGDPHLFTRDEILELDKLPEGKTMVGYIFGGIESTRPNTFFSNQPNLTKASNRIFEVYITKSKPTGAEYLAITQSHLLNFDLYPNPANNSVRVEFFVAEPMSPMLYLYTPSGKLLRAFDFGRLEIGSYHHTFSILEYDPGVYLVKMRYGNIEKTRKLVVK